MTSKFSILRMFEEETDKPVSQLFKYNNHDYHLIFGGYMGIFSNWIRYLQIDNYNYNQSRYIFYDMKEEYFYTRKMDLTSQDKILSRSKLMDLTDYDDTELLLIYSKNLSDEYILRFKEENKDV